MARIATCPKCQQKVSVPQAAIDATEVCCPLCSAAFELGEAEVSELSELVILGGEIAKQEEAGDWFTPPDELEATSQEVPPEDAAEVEQSEDLPDFAAIGVAGDVPDLGIEEKHTRHKETAVGDQEKKETGADEDVDQDEAQAGGIPFEPTGGAGTAVAAPPTKKKKKQPGPVSMFVGIVVFGILGLVLGYVILFFVARQRADELAAQFGFKRLLDKVTGQETAVASSNPDSSNSGQFDFTPGGAFEQNQKDAGDTTGKIPRDTSVNEPKKSTLDVPPFEPLDGPEIKSAEPPPSRLASFRVEQVREALEDARGAVGEVPGKLTLPVFQKLCEVGHRLAWIDGVSPARRDEEELAAEELVIAVATTDNNYGTIGKSSIRWLFGEVRPPAEKGVILTGKVVRVRPSGEGFQSDIELSENQSVVVLSRQRPPFHVSDLAVVAGSIVESSGFPALGYAGDEPLVVVAGVAVRL